MHLLDTLIKEVNSILWGYVLIALLVIAGLYFTFKTRVFQITGIKYIWKNTVAALFSTKPQKGGISPFKAVSTALGGTIGVGNTVGVAVAICDGGAGALFWMWVSAFLGMIIKYAEIYLAVLYKKRNSFGGPMFYIGDGLNKRRLSRIFCFLCIMTSFGMGNMSQSSALAGSVNASLSISVSLIGIFTAVSLAIILSGGARRIINATGTMVPIVSLLYIITSFICIFRQRDMLPGAVTDIFSGAFGIKAAGGALKGTVVAGAVRFGFSRGIFTNEAGLGSAPIVHSSSNEDQPQKQAVWGIFEVFIDTVLVCTLTALVILTSEVYLSGSFKPELLTFSCFSASFGKAGEIGLTVSMILFALASMLCWSYYGKCAVKYLFPHSKTAQTVYSAVFCIISYIGAVISNQSIWQFADLFNALMLAVNLYAVMRLKKFVHADKKPSKY